ncbi:CD36 family [Trinorchestia longiramus]|nr:CD36 family [Trinorchestia longiramus]
MEVEAFGYSNPSFTNDVTTSDETSEPKISSSVRPEENTSDTHKDSKNRSNSRNENETSEGETLKRDLSSNPLQQNSKGDAENVSNSTHKKSCCMSKKKFYAAVVVCVLTAAFGVAMLAGGYDAMFDTILKSQMEVKPGSRAYDIWKDTPVPLSLSFYLFNLTNPEEFQNGAKPNVSEVGPYVYREYHEKTNLTFNDNNTVAFYQKRWWVWDQEASGDRLEDDPICILNTVPVSAAYSVRKNDFLLSGLNIALNTIGETLTPVYCAKDILFYGYEDPLLDLVYNTTTEHPNVGNGSVVDLPPGLLDYDNMAWFYKRNLSETYDGLYNMFTGTDTLDHLGNIDKWNTMNETEYYTSPCNGIFGSAGEIWPPYQTATNISFWCSDMCATLTLMYKEVITDEFGLEGFRYWADENAFASPDKVPENICYCYEDKDEYSLKNDPDTCPLSGLRDAQTCRMGSPAYISFPHFLHGDPALTAAVNGILEPDEERDQLYIDMIPELGVPMDVRARMQINMQVQPYPGTFGFHFGKIDLLANVREVVMPLLWFEVKAGLTKELAAELKPVVFLMRTATMTIIWILMIVGGVSGFLFLTYRQSKI